MSPAFLHSLLELAKGDQVGAESPEQEAVTEQGERITLFRNAQSGGLVCSLSRESTQLDDEGRASVCEALLRLTANSRFSDHPKTGSLQPDGSAALSLQLNAALLEEPEQLDAQLDRATWTLGDLLKAGTAAVPALDATPLAQEAAWIKV